MDANDDKKATITFSSAVSGPIDVFCGVNLNVDPWYKEYKKSIQVGGCSPTGFSIAEMEANIIASPNPFTEQTTVSIKSGEKILSLKLYDLNGIEHLQNSILNLTEISFGSELRAGVYILHIVTENSTINKRIVKSK